MAVNLSDGRCSSCHSNSRLRHIKAPERSSAFKEAWANYSAVLNTLLDLPQVLQSKRHRVLATLAVRCHAIHTTDDEVLRLDSSPLAAWCLRALTSSSRELRVAGGRGLAAFLRRDLPTELRDHNRRSALTFLRQLTDQAALSQHETLISAWGQVAIICGDKELNLALLRLVDYLGHTNTLIPALAASELEKIARTCAFSPEELFRPFWRTVAVAVVQDLFSIPQKAQQLAEFLEMTVDRFLLLTQRETIPYLVLTKKHDVLQRIAAARSYARGQKCTVQDIILQPQANLAAILALLLSQPSTDVEATASSLLAEAEPNLKHQDLAGLLKIDSVSVACELLKTAADEDEGRKAKVSMLRPW